MEERRSHGRYCQSNACFTEEADAYQMVRWDDLGTAEKVVVNHENTIVVLNEEQQSKVAEAVESLWKT